ncbi:MAG: right-handed parallel beta-helix repeat-containing protein [bacterium]
MKRLSVYLLLAILPALGWLAGCSDPTPNPVKPEPEFCDGTRLTQENLVGANPVIGIGNSPYAVESDLVVDSGMTLTIEPGVTLAFKGLYWMKIKGKLVAEGQPNDPIRFTTCRHKADYGQWRGLAFLNETEQSVVRHCIFEYGAYFELDTMTERGREAQKYAGMLAVINSSPIIENNIIFYNQNNGVYVTGQNSQPTVRYNIIFKNDASAIRADSSTVGSFIPEFNCGAENSSLDFLTEDSTIGGKDTVNANLDPTDFHFNFTLSPMFVDWENGDFRLQSCSPCIDAGPPDVQGPGGDLGRIDFGVCPYVRTAAELRGIQSGSLSPEIYRMSCHVRIPPGETLTIPAGTIINVSGLYNFEVFGTLIVEGTPTNRVYVRSGSASPGKGDWGQLIFYGSLDGVPSRVSYTTFENFDYCEVAQPGATFTGCVFRQGYQSGVRVKTGSANPVVIDHCRFDDLGLFGLWVDTLCVDSSCSIALTSSIVVRNSLVENCMGDGVVLMGAPPVEDATSRLHNNIIRNCGVNGIICKTFVSPQIINNVITGTGYAGIQCYNNSSPLVLNNIIAGCGRPGIIARTSSFPTVDYNDVWQNNILSDSTTNYEGIELPPGHQNLNTDPLFVSGSLAVLQEGPPPSPCIDKGHPGTEYNDTDGSRNDMGAYGGPSGGGIGPSIARDLTSKSVRR